MVARQRIARREEDDDEWVGRDADEFRELEEAVAIAEHSLDVNCIQHSDLFYRVSRSLARYTAKRDEQKQKTSEIEAFVDAELRRAPVADGSRLTEAAIANQKTMDPRIKLARKELAKLNRIVGQITALKEAYLQRSYSLKGMIDLHLAGYFGDPSQRSSVRDRLTERAERAKAAQRLERSQRGGRDA